MRGERCGEHYFGCAQARVGSGIGTAAREWMLRFFGVKWRQQRYGGLPFAALTGKMIPRDAPRQGAMPALLAIGAMAVGVGARLSAQADVLRNFQLAN
jgi:hypothetical protein